VKPLAWRFDINQLKRRAFYCECVGFCLESFRLGPLFV